MNDLFFRVAEADFRIRCADMANCLRMLPSYETFRTERPASEPMFTLEISETNTEATAMSANIGEFDCGDSIYAVCHLPNGGYRILISNHKNTPGCALFANADFSQCKATLCGDTPHRAFGLNNALMVAFAFAGAWHSICLMHASVVMKDGKGYLFLGKSGTGKSTHSRLWLQHIPGTYLLNDDNPAVRMVGGKAYVYGTPWSGKTPCYRNIRAQAAGFIRLEQAPENAICRHSGARGFASLLSSCSTMIWDKASYSRICHTMASMAESVPVYHLRCRPDREAAELSYRTMAGA